MVTWRFSFLPLRIMTPRFRQLHDLRIDVPMPTRRFLQNPMMRKNSTRLIPALTLYGLMLIILCWHTTATVHVYLMTRGWSKLPQDSRNIWMSLPIDDRKLILGASNSVSSIIKTSSSTPSRGSLGCRHRTFTRHRDKRKVMFMDQQSDDATTSTEPTTDSTDDNLVDDIMGQFDVDFDTL
jgi:hypothetical protein